MKGRKDVLAWCLFDFANSSYTTVITTVAFSVYFRDVSEFYNFHKKRN